MLGPKEREKYSEEKNRAIVWRSGSGYNEPIETMGVRTRMAEQPRASAERKYTASNHVHAKYMCSERVADTARDRRRSKQRQMGEELLATRPAKMRTKTKTKRCKRERKVYKEMGEGVLTGLCSPHACLGEGQKRDRTGREQTRPEQVVEGG